MSAAERTGARGAVRGDLASPCINVCRMDDTNGLCTGCLRTLDEIAGWSRASDDAKRAILLAIDRRRAAQAPDAAGRDA